MKYKWASPRTNPAAHYLPQTFTPDEERLLYRCLSTAAVSTERRGAAAGPLQIKGKEKKYVSGEQEAVLRMLERTEGKPADVLMAVKEAIERNKDRKPQRARVWRRNKSGDSEFDVTQFDDWWHRTAMLTKEARIEAVHRLRKKHISATAYATPVLSGTIGFYGRDSQNPWGRACGWNKLHEHNFERCLPLIRRIDEAFRLAVPSRYEAQKRFCDKLDPRFVIPGTCFTTITVNKNFRTYPHRDSGDLSQGLSNISVFSNGREFTGGHLILPEFNAEFTLAPRDLLFIANHEYVHENTPIVDVDPDSERMSIVCYAREDLAFCGTLEYENLRKEFKREFKIYPGIWESPRWYNYLMRKLGHPTKSLVEKARANGILNREILTLYARFGIHPLFDLDSWECCATFDTPSAKQQEALRALTTAIQFRTPRQDKWTAEDGPVVVDAIYLDAHRWALAYCESASGAVKLPNNRFNCQAVAHLPFVPPEIGRLSRDVCDWLLERWAAGETVRLVRISTGIPEAPQRLAFTTIDLNRNAVQYKKILDAVTRDQLYKTASKLDLFTTWRLPPRTKFYYDLGWSHQPMLHGVLSESGPAVCDSIAVRADYEAEFLAAELEHWRKRAKNVGSSDFKTRYERIGTYGDLPPPLPLALAGSPWKIRALPDRFEISKRRRWKSSVHRVYRTKPGSTELSWTSDFQGLPALGARVGSSASLLVWRYKDNVSGGQAVVTDGTGYWLFQALGSREPIRKGRGPIETMKVSEPMIVGHLQRSEIVMKPDKTGLGDKLRKLAQFVPSPFSPMFAGPMESYNSKYRLGRAKLLAIGGEPATGKTFIVKQLIARADDWKSIRPKPLLDALYSKSLNLYVLGKYETDGGVFQGTDKLSKSVHQNAMEFLVAIAGKPVNIVFEGDRLFTRKYLEGALNLNINLVILRFLASKATKARRHLERADKQNEKFLRGQETKVRNIWQSAALWDCVEDVRNENADDQQRILMMIEWFLGRAKPFKASKSIGA